MTLRIGLALASAALLAGCGPQTTAAGVGSGSKEANAASGFKGPPRATGVMPLPGGGTEISGQAEPASMVRLATPQGRAFSATSDSAGAWKVRLPIVDQATLFGLSSRGDGRTVQAEGYLAVWPAPSAGAALLRAGAGASRIAPTPKGGIHIDSIDVDVAGAAVVSGGAPAGEALTAWLDGVEAGEGTVGDSGRFSVALSEPLTARPQLVGVRTTQAQGQARIEVGVQSVGEGGPYRSQRVADAWRIDWITPGGGLQTTFLFDRPEAGA